VARPGSWLERLAVAGNAVFVAWIVFNAVDEGFRGTLPEIVSALGLIALLGLNTALLIGRRNG
jgi:hypothetical protein